MTIKIWVVDDDKNNELEALGLPANGENYQLVDFYFRKSELACFWIDIEESAETGSVDIFFNVGSITYRTPYSQHTANLFHKIIEND